ncbi:hypothetical protein E2C01_042019 [Portunus trituberculatus]|uniref:Uncharacterized protein n=1 Tax=Portunus trituberculatus TaxID=210409 RepID=A0A5B7FLE6_PORTR|nr:hypothetical protein [Portunus trituberculatus]
MEVEPLLELVELPTAGDERRWSRGGRRRFLLSQMPRAAQTSWQLRSTPGLLQHSQSSPSSVLGSGPSSSWQQKG